MRSGDTLHLRHYADEKNTDRGGEWGTAVGLFTRVTSAQPPFLFYHLQVFSDTLSIKQMFPVHTGPSQMKDGHCGRAVRREGMRDQRGK